MTLGKSGRSTFQHPTDIISATMHGYFSVKINPNCKTRTHVQTRSAALPNVRPPGSEDGIVPAQMGSLAGTETNFATAT